MKILPIRFLKIRNHEKSIYTVAIKGVKYNIVVSCLFVIGR
jgi:hypothetical protein